MHTHSMRGTCTLLEGYRDLPKMKVQNFGIPWCREAQPWRIWGDGYNTLASYFRFRLGLGHVKDRNLDFECSIGGSSRSSRVYWVLFVSREFQSKPNISKHYISPGPPKLGVLQCLSHSARHALLILVVKADSVLHVKMSDLRPEFCKVHEWPQAQLVFPEHPLILERL